jgi:hypothetical protein
MAERHLIMKSEIGPALGVSRQRGYQFTQSKTLRFPKPRKYIGLDLDRPLWDLKEITRWRERNHHP